MTYFKIIGSSILCLMLSFLNVKGQDKKMQLVGGLNFNQSNMEFNTTTGIGLFLEVNTIVQEKFRLGYRFEPTALAYGVLTYESDPCSIGCKEGANYVLNNYLKVDYLFGEPKYGVKGGRRQWYAGVSLNLLTHRRWIITSRRAGAFRHTLDWVTNGGAGIRGGVLLGKIDFSASYNLVGRDYQNYAGFGLGYIFH